MTNTNAPGGSGRIEDDRLKIRVGLTLACVVAVTYAAFYLLSVYVRPFMATPIRPGLSAGLALAFACGVIWLVLTAVYARVSNRIDAGKSGGTN